MKKIDQLIEQWEAKARNLEAELRGKILEWASTLQTRNGYLLYTAENMAKVAMIDKIVDDFNSEDLLPFIAIIYLELDNLDKWLTEYYQSLGLQVSRMEQMAVFKEEMGRYLRQVTTNNNIALELKEYSLGAIASKKRFSEYVQGVRHEMGTRGVSGKLQRYLRTYLWDAVMVFYRIAANMYAEELNLNYFYYRGGLIETSREFCIKKNDKLFHRDDALRMWPSDPALPGDPLGYNPLTDLGRWNCRHYLEWITDEMAEKQMKK